jgi:hypothetical protein
LPLVFGQLRQEPPAYSTARPGGAPPDLQSGRCTGFSFTRIARSAPAGNRPNYKSGLAG